MQDKSTLPAASQWCFPSQWTTQLFVAPQLWFSMTLIVTGSYLKSNGGFNYVAYKWLKGDLCCNIASPINELKSLQTWKMMGSQIWGETEFCQKEQKKTMGEKKPLKAVVTDLKKRKKRKAPVLLKERSSSQHLAGPGCWHLAGQVGWVSGLPAKSSPAQADANLRKLR